jgi:4-amino-4-deoxy-L-arabinose transferase-like glycosyltransferase
MRRTSENDAAELREPRSGTTRTLRAVLLALSLAVFVGLVWHVDADTPIKLGTVRFDAGAYCDEGYKTLDARNRALFGQAHWTPEDQYAGWAARSPVTVGLDTLVFRTFGVRLRYARLVSLGFALGSALLLHRLLERRFGQMAAALGVLLLVVHPLFAVYGRLALFEVKVLFFSLVGLTALLSKRGPAWLRWSIVVLAFGLACGSKETAVFGIASMVLAWILLRMSEGLPREGTRRLAIWGIVVAGLVLLAVLERLGIAVRLRGRELSNLVQFGRELFVLSALRMNPVLTILGAIASIATLRRLVTRMPAPRAEDVLMVCWFWGQTIAFTIFEYHPSRYYLVALPGLLWLAVLASREAASLHEELLVRPGGVATILVGLVLSIGAWQLVTSGATYTGVLHPRNVESQQVYLARFGGLVLVSWPVCVAAVLFLGRFLPSPASVRTSVRVLLFVSAALNLGALAAWMRAPRYELRAGAEQVRKLPADSVLVGDWAPELTLDTPLRTLYLTWDNLHRLRRIKPTHVVVMRRSNPLHREQIDELFPGARAAEPDLRFPYANDTAEIYRFSLLW